MSKVCICRWRVGWQQEFLDDGEVCDEPLLVAPSLVAVLRRCVQCRKFFRRRHWTFAVVSALRSRSSCRRQHEDHLASPASVLTAWRRPAAGERLSSSPGRHRRCVNRTVTGTRALACPRSTRYASTNTASTGRGVHDPAASRRQPHRPQPRDRQTAAADGRRTTFDVDRSVQIGAVASKAHPGSPR